MNQADQQKLFLESLWPSIPTGGNILIWTLQNKISHWAGSTDAAAEMVAAAEKSGLDSYMGVGIAPQGLNSRQRCQADKVLAIPGLWIDVDFANPNAHKKGRLPESLEQVDLSLIVQPSLIVNTGHGCHLWWLFREPWEFDSDEERQRAADIAYGWNSHVQDIFLKQGFELDQVSDLARIMRVPGTTNRKAEPVPVEIRSSTSWRYNPSDFEEYAAKRLAPNKNTKSTVPISTSTSLLLLPDAQPPFDRFHALLENVHSFKQSWERTKKGMKDTSPSAWDFALAGIALKADWTDQEVTNLLIASRRKHGDDLKLRLDYYQTTIARARGEQERDVAAEKLEVAEQTGASVDQRLEWVSQVIGIKITGMLKYLSEPAEYRLITDTGGILIGEIGALMTNHTVRCKIAEQTNLVVPRMNAQTWDKVVQALLLSCKTEEVGKEATEHGSVDAWLANYFTEHHVLDVTTEKEIQDAVASGSPFKHDGLVFLSGSRFRTWLGIRHGERISAKRMGILLRAYGASPKVMAFTVDGIQTTRNLWGVPV